MSTSIPLAPYPSSSLRTSIPPPEWSAIVESWNTALSVLLQLPSAKFTTASSSDNLARFLLSYLSHSSTNPDIDVPQRALRKKTFLVIHRLLTAHPKTLLETPGFLIGFSRVYSRVPAAQRLLAELWKTQETVLEAAVKALKKTHLPVFSKATLSFDDAAGLGRLFQMSPQVAAMFLAGDEFAEVALDGDEIVAKLFARALCEAARANWSVVIDGLYTITLPSAGQKEHALAKKLAGLGVGSRLKELAEGTDYEGRVSGVVEKLQAFAPPTPVRRKKANKDKGKSVMTPQDQEETEMASKVDQIRDLFPDLGSGFVRRCLHALGGSVEAVTSALLEENLPAELIEADRSEE
jgi:activating signal cointegrator complex subunit 2